MSVSIEEYSAMSYSLLVAVVESFSYVATKSVCHLLFLFFALLSLSLGKTKSFVGTAQYVSPEMLNTKRACFA